jgi:predicted secreted hydrolase
MKISRAINNKTHKRSNLFWTSLWLALLALLLAACSSGPATMASATVAEALSYGDDAAYARPMEPVEFDFPAVHGPHPEYRTEWWYYTGNLTGEDGREFGYQLTFFRSALAPDMPERESSLATNQMYMAHFALTDAAASHHVSFERFSRGSADLAGATGEPVFEVWLESWSARQIEPGVMHLQATAEQDDQTYAIDLTMRETREPLLHGDQGLSQKSPEAGNANYYYSLVQMETTGTVTTADERMDVTGLSWMDHEFGTSALSGDTTGWDWFSVTLDNDMVFMFGEFHNGQGEGRYVYEGTLAYPDGRRFSLNDADFELEALDTWRSPRSGIVYPHTWRVTFPEHDIELFIEPIIQDQEMAVSFVYYEGATHVRGSVEGEPVTGRGYVELTGYSGESQYQR